MVIFLAIAILIAYFFGIRKDNPQSSPTPSVSSTVTPSPMASAKVSATPTVPQTPKPSISSTPKPTATKTPTPAPSPTPAVTPTTTPVTSLGTPKIAGCSVFPANNSWNTDISNYPVHTNSSNYIASIGAGGHLHPDFGGNGAYGIPYITVPGTQPKVAINFTAYGDESDAGPYPIPTTAPIEGGASSDGDRHVLAVDTSNCILYELYRAFPTSAGWNADSGTKWDLRSNALRPDYWTSTDAAGLPVLPGLVRYDEVAAGAINHAIRFTVQRSQKAFIHPATHYASSSTDANRPPMGLRLRLKKDFDISGFTGQARVILEALKKYGMIVADNGSNWYITGAADTRWNDDNLGQLKTIPGSAFEAVETGPLIK